jgi:hypothetical protein
VMSCIASIALVIKFKRTCCNWPRSAITRGRSSRSSIKVDTHCICKSASTGPAAVDILWPLGAARRQACGNLARRLNRDWVASMSALLRGNPAWVSLLADNPAEGAKQIHARLHGT